MNMEDDDIQQDECLICTEPFLSLEAACNTKTGRLRSVGACNHCSNICSICMLRIRVLQHSKKCPACTAELPIIICTDRLNASLEDYNIWGDNIGPDFSFDSRSSIFYPNDYYKKVILPLWLWKCNVCNHTKRDAKGLKTHVMSEHNLHICNLCVEHKLVFPFETKIYNQSLYEIHLKRGDNDGSLGHPMCEFCRIRYFDKTLLFQHLSKDHYTCHICEKEGIQFKYYQDYNKLEYHFRTSHFICEEKHCLDKKFIAFSSQIELHAHTMKWHPLLLNGSKSLPLHFKVASKGSSTNSLNSNASDSYLINDDDNSRRNRDSAFDSGIRGRNRQGEWHIEIEDLQLHSNTSNRSQLIPTQERISSSLSSEHLLNDDYPALSRINGDRQTAASRLVANTSVTEDFPVLGGSSTASTASMTWLSTKKGSQKTMKSNSSKSVQKPHAFKDALSPSLSLGIQMHMGLIPAYPVQANQTQQEVQKEDSNVNQQSNSNEKEGSVVSKDDTSKKVKVQSKANKNTKNGWDDAFRSVGLISNKVKKPTGFSVVKLETRPSSGYKKETVREEDASVASLDLSKLKPAGKYADTEDPLPIKVKNTSKPQVGINLLSSSEAISINTPNTPKAAAVVSPRPNIQIMPPAPPIVAPPPGFDKFPLTEGSAPPGFDVFPVGVVPPTTSALSRPSSARPSSAKPPITSGTNVDKGPIIQKTNSNDNKPIVRSGDGWVHIGGTSQSRAKQEQIAMPFDPDFPSLPAQSKVSNIPHDSIQIEKDNTQKQNENKKSKKNPNKKNDDLKSLAFVKPKK